MIPQLSKNLSILLRSYNSAVLVTSPWHSANTSRLSDRSKYFAITLFLNIMYLSGVCPWDFREKYCGTTCLSNLCTVVGKNQSECLGTMCNLP
uniref:Uncharacterized protein n=1 Tax=Arundo donax TaxID=35708 RepID=A0A0A9G6M6_ARUDO